MQYLLNQPQTSLQLINWLKQHQVERVYQLTPFFKGATKHTSPLCVKTSKTPYYHAAMVETALQAANSLEEIPPDAIMFFPNYPTLHAAFTVAKEKWTIEQAIEYIGIVADKEGTFFKYLHPEDRLRLPKVDDVLYPYYHWCPVAVSSDDYPVTSAHFPYIGNRPIPQYSGHVASSSNKIFQAKTILLEKFTGELRTLLERVSAELQVESPQLQHKIPKPPIEYYDDDEDEDL